MSSSEAARQRLKRHALTKPTCVAEFQGTAYENVYSDWYHPSLNLVYAPGKRGIYASEFIPAGPSNVFISRQ